MSGSRTNEGLKGSEVGTRSQDDDENKPFVPNSNLELRRRKFFDYTRRSQGPAIFRRRAVPRTVNTLVETIVNMVGGETGGKDDDNAIPTITSLLSSAPFAVPSVPPFPSLENPTVPTVPPYPFNTPSSQSIISSPPSSPVPSDTSFTATESPTPSVSSPAPSPSEESSDISDSILSTNAPVITTSYSNNTITTSTRSDVTASSGLDSSATRATTFSTRISGSLAQSGSGSTATGAAATVGATGAGSGSVATSGPDSDAGGGSTSPTVPPTPQVVGGVVGGIAGLAIILLVLLYFLRRYRRNLQTRGELLEPDGSGRNTTNTMSVRSSNTPLVAAVASSLRKMRPASSHTNATGHTSTSDRGFQRVAGRKIEPVLVSGGDGYGGNYGAFEKKMGLGKETGAASSSHPEAQPLASTAFYKDDNDYYGGHGSGTSTPTGLQTQFVSDNRDFADIQDHDYDRGPSPDPIPVMRPSPARSPVTTSAGLSQLAPQRSGPTMVSDAPPTPTVPTRFIPDGVGRSLISLDGSRGSRFTESV